MRFFKTLIILFLMAFPVYFNIYGAISTDMPFVVSCYVGSLIMSLGLVLSYKLFSKHYSYRSSFLFAIINDLLVCSIIGYFIYEITLGKFNSWNIHYFQVFTIIFEVAAAIIIHIQTHSRKINETPKPVAM